MNCKICGSAHEHKTFLIKERMFKTHDEFEYFECSNCLCIQIKEVPNNIQKYYPQNYYSFSEPTFSSKLTPLRKLLKKYLAKQSIGEKSIFGFLLSLIFPNPFPWLLKKKTAFQSRILDVGCGSGRLLLSMQRSGFKNLIGIDPYNHDNIEYNNGVRIFKKEIFDLDDKFDIIMMHHSLEHMWNQKEIFLKLYSLLNDNGYIIIRIPVSNSYAWRRYQTFWVQLDAPRHYFLHSINSLNLLAQKCRLEIFDIVFDSSSFQFVGSEKYILNIGLFDPEPLITKNQKRIFEKAAKTLNRINDGDSASFYLRKKE